MTVLNRHIVQTQDGSSTLYIPDLEEHYHSVRGALTESLHVYITHGLNRVKQEPIHLLEVGMGTGLNVLLSASTGRSIYYDALEPYPLLESEWQQLQFQYEPIQPEWIQVLHQTAPGEVVSINRLNLVWYKQKLEDFDTSRRYDLVYFDAFAPSKQTGPWMLSNLEKIHRLLNHGGILTTYCANGAFKRNLKQVGFMVENPPGPMGKREITIATKI